MQNMACPIFGTIWQAWGVSPYWSYSNSESLSTAFCEFLSVNAATADYVGLIKKGIAPSGKGFLSFAAH
jgi:hypothetical protein